MILPLWLRWYWTAVAMSATTTTTTTTALLFLSRTQPNHRLHLTRRRTKTSLNNIPLLNSLLSHRNSSPSSRSSLFGQTLLFKDQSFNGSRSFFTSFRPFSPVMEWQDCTVKMEIDVPTSVAYNCYADRESIPRWMPFISSVKVLEDKPDLSKWSLKYKAFGQNLEYSWLARNMQPIPNQKIHWRSLEGLPNRGAVRFYPKGSSSCMVELTVSYEVPQLLTPVASALKPFLESLLLRGLERFATFSKSYAADSK